MRLALVCAALALAGAGCSTVAPQATGREGLIDIFARLEPANKSSHYREPTSTLASTKEEAPAAVEVDAPSDSRTLGLHWPLSHVKVTSSFGQRGSEFHEGVDLKAPSGTLVFAAQAGRVIYAGSKIRGYGRLIVIKHEHDISTVYAHNSRLLVKKGDHVAQGQKIAITGKSGHVSGPHLHFEVRKGVAAVDPVRVMPSVGLKAEL